MSPGAPAVRTLHTRLAYLFKPLCSGNSERKVDQAAGFFTSRWCRLLVLNTAQVIFHLFKYVVDVLVDYFPWNFKPHSSKHLALRAVACK